MIQRIAFRTLPDGFLVAHLVGTTARQTIQCLNKQCNSLIVVQMDPLLNTMKHRVLQTRIDVTNRWLQCRLRVAEGLERAAVANLNYLHHDKATSPNRNGPQVTVPSLSHMLSTSYLKSRGTSTFGTTSDRRSATEGSRSLR